MLFDDDEIDYIDFEIVGRMKNEYRDSKFCRMYQMY